MPHPRPEKLMRRICASPSRTQLLAGRSWARLSVGRVVAYPDLPTQADVLDGASLFVEHAREEAGPTSGSRRVGGGLIPEYVPAYHVGRVSARRSRSACSEPGKGGQTVRLRFDLPPAAPWAVLRGAVPLFVAVPRVTPVAQVPWTRPALGMASWHWLR